MLQNVAPHSVMLREVAASRNKLKKQSELSSHSVMHTSMNVRKRYGDGVVEKVVLRRKHSLTGFGAQDDGNGASRMAN